MAAIGVYAPRTELFMSDIHFPFHDKEAWGLALRVLRKVQPDLIWLGGDIIDFYAVSHWERSPKRRTMLQDEIDVAVKELRKVRKAAPNARMVLQEGNHEDRLRRYLWGRAPELAGLAALELPKLLHFEKLGIEFIGHGNPTKVGHLWHIHGDEVGGGYVNIARGKLLKLFHNVIFGHHHKAQVDTIRALNGKTYAAWGNGCLCGMYPEYVANPQWTHGLSLVRYAKGGAFHVNQLIFFPGAGGKLTCMVDGVLLESK